MNIYIKQNSTVSELANIFKIHEQLIISSNKHLNTFSINQNEQINIPGYTCTERKIKNGDSIVSLCKTYHVTEDMLLLLNGEMFLTKETILIPVKINDIIVEDVDHYTYDKMSVQIEELINVYPFIQKKTIGYTVLNKPIIELSIGSGPYFTHFNASFHGNEWITSASLMKCVNEYARLLTTYYDDESLMNTFKKMTISIVPMVNPDGVNLVLNGIDEAKHFKDDVYKMNEKSEDFSRWKANIVGVDLNKQFPAKWEIERNRKSHIPTYRDYPGKRPLSQPESIAMASLTMKNNFHRVHALHTQGEEIYWGFNMFEPSISKKIVQQYERVTNYKSVQYVDNYAGYKDWFIKTFKRPGFTIELGKGVNPLPIEQFNKIYDATLNIFLTNLLFRV